jgi:predicted nucleotidyltransferase component of viral defense system
MDLGRTELIKKLILQVIFSDNELSKRLVLKGGNVSDLIYGMSSRSSVDLDFSMDGEFSDEEKKKVFDQLVNSLTAAFKARDLMVFDVEFNEKPLERTDNMVHFRGGYDLQFKVIEIPIFEAYKGNDHLLKQKALDLGRGKRKAFKIDISKHEYCDAKRPHLIEGVTVFAYSPEMLVFEKLRALCQQMPRYLDIVKKSRGKARARDFFDIFEVMSSYRVNLTNSDNVRILAEVFKAKHVPMELIGNIHESREFHRPDFGSVRATVKPGLELGSFDFYFDFVIENCVRPLEPFWNK